MRRSHRLTLVLPCWVTGRRRPTQRQLTPIDKVLVKHLPAEAYSFLSLRQIPSPSRACPSIGFSRRSSPACIHTTCGKRGKEPDQAGSRSDHLLADRL